VPRLNLARVLLHFGTPPDVRRGVALLDETLDRSPGGWQVDPLDDVLPWDFCPTFFNYRRYFDTITRSMATPDAARPELIAIILASLSYYRAMYVGEVAPSRSAVDLVREAVRLDAGFAEYGLYLSRLLIDRSQGDDLAEAAEHLRRLSQESARLLEILDLAGRLPDAMRRNWFADLERRAARFWSAVEMRETMSDPLLRSCGDVTLRPAAEPGRTRALLR
jgi:hypothetical protein